MSVIDDLVQRIEDVELKKRIQIEIQKIAKQKKFGLVFENHLPECTPLYEIPVIPGRDVAERTRPINEIWTVLKIDGDTAICRSKKTRLSKNSLWMIWFRSLLLESLYILI